MFARVAKYAADFAGLLRANVFVSSAGGILHDLGAAMYGKENHHITGVKEASIILVKCGCPEEFIGSILGTIYSHRGSQKIEPKTVEAKCVSAADAKDHFIGLRELWNVKTGELNFSPADAYRIIQEKLKNDWEKTSPLIQDFLGDIYEDAQKELLEIASVNGSFKKMVR